MAVTTTKSRSEALDEDVLYGALSDKRRRYTLHYLKQIGDAVPVQQIAEQVAAWENDKPINELDSKERKRVYVALYQSHLSTMDAEGLVQYDEDAGTVELAAEVEDIDIYLEVVPPASIPWSIYYAGLSVANALLLALAWAEVYPFTLLPDLAWGVVILVTFGVSAFTQAYTNRQMHIGDDGPPPELQTT